MTIMIRRSGGNDAMVNGAEMVAETLDIADVHALLYRRGAIDLADTLTGPLTPSEACAAARRIRDLVRRAARGRIFRDYRTALQPADAERLGLVALWYERAGRAGCRVWADLRDAASLAAPSSPDEAADVADGEPREPVRLMPDWLTAPESSVWSA